MLSPKQQRFIKEYLIDLNGTQAAIRAGYSKKTANEQAARLLANVSIQQRLKEEMDTRCERIERTADDVVRALWRMAELDIADYLDVAEGGEVCAKPFDQLPEGASKYIDKIKERRTIKESNDGKHTMMFSNIEYELPDKMKAYELLGRHHGIFKDKVDLNHNIDKELFDSARKVYQELSQEKPKENGKK
jgi:phage terminase small subunit